MNKSLFRLLLVVSALSLFGQLLLQPGVTGAFLSFGAPGTPQEGGGAVAGVLLAGAPLAALLLLYLLPRLDPRRENYAKHQRAYTIFMVAITTALVLGSWASTLGALGYMPHAGAVTRGLAGTLLLVVGNFMPQLRPNFFLGLLTPWGIENEQVWRKTQRFAGVMFCLAGIAFLADALLGARMPPWGVAALSVAALLVAPYVYSYLTYRTWKQSQIPEEEQHADD